MKIMRMPVGIDDFAKLRNAGKYYVDKTGIISDIINDAPEVTLFTRPRRFGKTLCMRMLYEFFDIRKDSKALFDGLNIAEDKEFCDAHMNKYPTVFITFKDIKGNSFKSAYDLLEIIISKLYIEHSYLIKNDLFDENYKDVFNRIKSKTATVAEIKNSIDVLALMMEKYHSKPVVLLIDEYDVPMANAQEHSYYSEMIEVMSSMLSQALKGNSSLKFAVITGCLKIAKESIFTGLNNLSVDTIMSSRYGECFGFTEPEIKKILTDTELESHFDDVKEWYDGYKFGKADVYCPWDVVNYVRDLMLDEYTKPKAYWNNTSGNTIIRTFIDECKNDISEDFERLMSGDYIIKKISDSLTYNDLYATVQNFWSVMYFTGYLTRAEGIETNTVKREIALKIPNKEVYEIFETTVSEWFEENVSKWNTKTFTNAIWNKQYDIATKEISKLLIKTISYHDYREDFYHAFLAGIFTGAGYYVKSNRESGLGRNDVVVKNRNDRKLAIFEIKRSDKFSELERDCVLALNQIDTKLYAEEYLEEGDIDEVICYGISFFKKQCRVKLNEKN